MIPVFSPSRLVLLVILFYTTERTYSPASTRLLLLIILYYYKLVLPRVQKPRLHSFFWVSWPWPLSFHKEINGLPGLILEHFYVKFGDPSCSSFWDTSRAENRQTNRQTDERRWKHYSTAIVGVGKYNNNVKREIYKAYRFSSTLTKLSNKCAYRSSGTSTWFSTSGQRTRILSLTERTKIKET